jgi:hypothetical protein
MFEGVEGEGRFDKNLTDYASMVASGDEPSEFYFTEFIPGHEVIDPGDATGSVMISTSD